MSLACVGCLSISCFAQQIPSSDFDEEWTQFKPWWQSKTESSSGEGSFVGQAPSTLGTYDRVIYWNFSNIQCSNQKQNTLILGEKSKTPYGSTGASVYVQNRKCSWLGGRIEPGYIALGTPWSGSSYNSYNINNGRAFGTYNGTSFNFRPDAISFVYKTEGENDEPTLILYSYYNNKGKAYWSQKDVPRDIKINGEAYTNSMTNRDLNVLGISETFQGGDVSTTGDPVRISKLIERLPNENEWTEKTYEIPYESEDTPSRLNIIFSAGEYNTLDQKEGEALHLDNVKLVYFSRLENLSVNGMEVPNFSPDTYEYTLATDMPQNEGEIEATCLGNSNSGQTEVALFPEENKVTVTVTNKNATLEGANPIPEDVKDIDGNTSHTYTLLFAKSSSITNIEAAKADEHARYFDMKGIEVDKAALSPGLYIKRTGTTATKIIIR